MQCMWFGVFLIGLVACGGNKKAPDTLDEAPPPRPPGEELVQAMHSNLSLTASAHTLLMRGDLDGAKASIGGLASKPRIEGLPEPWMEQQVALRVRASEVSEATTLQEAAQGIARVATACGDCHGSVGVEPDFYAVPAPPEDGPVPEHMAHHAWGADLMWKGLVAADEALYERGAKGLGEADLGAGSTAHDLGTLGEEVHVAAGEGLAADDAAGRAAAYAKVLASCGACHARAGLTPEIPYRPTLDARSP